jgi:hypothetical protein
VFRAMGVAVALTMTPASASAQASPVTLSRAPSVSENDYPERAIRAEVQGSVAVVIAVDATGAATGCTPVEIDALRFGLEDATCRVWTERARFSPARNASGVAIPGTYRAELNWVLAEPEPGPPAPAIVPPNQDLNPFRQLLGPSPQASASFNADTCISGRQVGRDYVFENTCNQPITLQWCPVRPVQDCTAETHYFTIQYSPYSSMNVVVPDGTTRIRHKACAASKEHVWYEADPYFDVPARYICSSR